ncbi:transposase [Streptomyces mirabilis]|uniref:IS110 family transposase n=1 Tax=Streptomyces mirabilis TaxID=68239 RepID=UPI00292E8977|nr:transposase [Streptomyces mirabilis]
MSCLPPLGAGPLGVCRRPGVRPRSDSTEACPGQSVPEVGVSTVDSLSSIREERSVILLGVDPHKSTHTATAVDPASNQQLESLRTEASLTEYRRLLAWGRRWPQRKWMVENASGLGRHLAQWLIARGETVIDVPATATSRVRRLTRQAWPCRRPGPLLPPSARKRCEMAGTRRYVAQR